MVGAASRPAGSCFEFTECTIHISKSLLVFKDYGYQLTTTKESNIRDVDVAPEYMDLLKEYYILEVPEKIDGRKLAEKP